MDYLDSLAVLGGASSRASDATNVHAGTAVAASDSSGGTVLVDPGGTVVSGDGSQLVEVPTEVDVRSGDVVTLSLIGADGSAKAMRVTGVVGGGDRMRDDVDAAQATANATATLIRQYSDGVLVCKTGCTVGALVNANGSFDVVSVSWNGDEPTVGATITEYGNNRTVFYGPDGKGKAYMSNGKFSADELEAYSAFYLPDYTLRETPNGGFGIYRRK